MEQPSCFQCVVLCWLYLTSPDEELVLACILQDLSPHCAQEQHRVHRFCLRQSVRQEIHAHSPNACRGFFGEGQLYWLFFLEYLFMCRLHEQKRMYYRSESLYIACFSLWSFISEKAAGRKNKITCDWFLRRALHHFQNAISISDGGNFPWAHDA